MCGLQVFPTVIEALSEVFAKRFALIRALLLPTVGMSVLDIVQTRCPSTPAWNLLFSVMGTPFYTLFAISCHRIVLLGEESVPARWGIYWSMRETRFLGWLLAISALVSVTTFLVFGVYMFLVLFVSNLIGFDLDSSRLYLVIVSIPIIFTFYFSLRFSLIFPAAATDKPIGIGDSWDMTIGHGVPLLFACAVPVLIAIILGYVLGFSLTGAGDILHISTRFVSSVAFGAIGVAVISVAYRQLACSSDATDAA